MTLYELINTIFAAICILIEIPTICLIFKKVKKWQEKNNKQYIKIQERLDELNLGQDMIYDRLKKMGGDQTLEEK